MNENSLNTDHISEELKLPFPLRQYQWEGVSFLARSESALLADEMGLGKTVQTAVALRLLLKEPQFDRVLIVVPAPLRLNWKREIEKWAPEIHCMIVTGNQKDRLAYYCLPIPILIASYEQIQLDVGMLHPCVRFDLVVLDEAQRIKNAGSSTSLACKLFPRDRSWALTGTPVENKPEDLVSIFSFVRQGLISKGLPLFEVHERINSFFLRRNKRDHLKDMPPIIVQDLPVEMTREQQETYQDIWDGRREMVLNANGGYNTVNLLAIITRLKQVCNFDYESNESAKFEMLETILEEIVATDSKVIIFSQYVKTIKWLESRIDCVPCEMFHGEMSESDRDTSIRNFEEKIGPKAILISLRAGGVGLNLPSASTVVLFDRWWNPAVESQAIQRAHRFGRKDILHVVRFCTVNSIEERISEILNRKQALFEKYVEDAPSANSLGFSQEELGKILNLNH